jgi:hypothetical protein
MEGTNKDHDEKKDVARELHWGKPNPKLVPTIPYIQLIYSEEFDMNKVNRDCKSFANYGIYSEEFDMNKRLQEFCKRWYH